MVRATVRLCFSNSTSALAKLPPADWVLIRVNFDSIGYTGTKVESGRPFTILWHNIRQMLLSYIFGMSWTQLVSKSDHIDHVMVFHNTQAKKTLNV